jgi:hypothetical protein
MLEISLRRPWDLLQKLAAEAEAGRLTHADVEERIAQMLKRFAERAEERSSRP